MGYDTKLSGKIRFSPPVGWAKLKDCQFLGTDHINYHRALKLHVREDEVETDEGLVLRRSSSVIIPTWEGEARAFEIESDLQDIVDWLGAGHIYTGYIEGHGEEWDDIWRLCVSNGAAIKVDAQITWPDMEAFR